MREVVWQYDPSEPSPEPRPQTVDEAVARLQAGNSAFVEAFAAPAAQVRHVISLTAGDVGAVVPVDAPPQAPFAAVVACSDARAPVQMFLSKSVNELFVVRVAGNVLGAECLGSLDFAVTNLPTVRLLAVIGHTECGAVTKAAQVYLAPETYLDVASNFALRTIVDAIIASVRAAADALESVHGSSVTQSRGYGRALIDVAIVAHAAVQAAAIEHTYHHRLGPELGVCYGVFDLASSLVGVPSGDDSGTWSPGLRPPPPDDQAFAELLGTLAASGYVRRRL